MKAKMENGAPHVKGIKEVGNLQVAAAKEGRQHINQIAGHSPGKDHVARGGNSPLTFAENRRKGTKGANAMYPSLDCE